MDQIISMLTQYRKREISIASLEDWMVSHLQAVLDSGDHGASAIADEVIALIVELGEGIVAEDEIRSRITAIIREREILVDERPIITELDGAQIVVRYTTSSDPSTPDVPTPPRSVPA